MQRGQREEQIWPQDLSQDPLGGGSGDVDFTKFLELDNDFTEFDNTAQQNGPSGLDTPMGRLAFSEDGQMAPLTPDQQAMLQNMQMEMGNMSSHVSLGHMQHPQTTQAQPYSQYMMYPQMQNPYQHQVPLTPVSMEMHGAKYQQVVDPAGQHAFDRQNTSFTPLVSPAQTPLENPWGIPDFVVNEAFFSPLTSPAIEAQQHYASTNATSSPIDLHPEQPAETRKSRRKLNPVSRVASVKNLRSSPATKGFVRRRQDSLSNSQKSSSVQQAGQSKNLTSVGRISAAVSSEDSVSPEPLSEALMRPPPVPHSRTPQAPRPQSRNTEIPATPATLMKILGKQAETLSPNGQSLASSELMEDIALPAAAAALPPRVLPEINTSLTHDDGDSTPTMSAKTPKLSADSTPRSAGIKTANDSQEQSGKASRGGRQNKKRQSISQCTISPALRPKISPSISPLVPSTGNSAELRVKSGLISPAGAGMPILSPETSALYLASKSNYQNIIDGTHLPGVSYPETLAENLSSKRTSHKLAEQGRRNRINIALKEIEGMLPASITAGTKKEKEAREDSGSPGEKPVTGASKASTVEMAITYIKKLQSELQETREKLEAAEKSLADGNSSGSQTSDQTNA